MRLSAAALGALALLASGTIAVAQSTGSSSSSSVGSSVGAGTGASPSGSSSITGTTGSTAGTNTPGTSTRCANADPLDTTALELGCLQTN